MKRFTMMVTIAAFVAAFAVPLAFAQGSPAPTVTPASPAKAEKAMKTEKAVRHVKAEKVESATMAKTDINSATKEELMKLPGVGDATADKIIAGRPYKTKAELSGKKILGAKAYAKIRHAIIATQAPGAAK